MISVPWSPELCDQLNYQQQSGIFHPYTCGNSSRHRVLVATPAGWVCPDCDYTQGWAHQPLTAEQIADHKAWLDSLKPKETQ